MKVLIACEESQAVCKAFRELGHDAYSCDILPCSGGHSEWHIQSDALLTAYAPNAVPGDAWDLIISFPPCTHLSLSGAKHFEKKRLSGEQEQGISFFLDIWEISNATENPRNIMSGWDYIRKWFPCIVDRMKDIKFPVKPSQTIQPYMFGDPFTKTTNLWLRGLQPLQPMNLVDPGERHITKGGKSLPSWYNLPPSPERGKIRSKTFQGIANAMAQQWG